MEKQYLPTDPPDECETIASRLPTETKHQDYPVSAPEKHPQKSKSQTKYQIPRKPSEDETPMKQINIPKFIGKYVSLQSIDAFDYSV